MYLNNPEWVEVEGIKYKINTDFRVAIECNEIAKDKGIGEYERALAIIYKLFGGNALETNEHHEKLLELAVKYLSCGIEIDEKSNEEPDMDYIQDADYIKTSFKSDYNIDLKEMHWWEFNNLINGLSNSEMGDCCILNKIRNLRNYDISTIKDVKQRDRIVKAQKKVALKKDPIKLNKKQEQSVNKFYELTGLNRKE